MDFFKKAGAIFYVNVATCVLALVGWIMLMVTGGVEGKEMEYFGVAIAFGIIAVLLIAGGTFASLKFGSQHFITAAVKLLGLVCLMIMVLILIMGRAETAAAAMTYEKDEHPETAFAFITAVVSLAFSLVAVIAIIVTSFFTTEKKI